MSKIASEVELRQALETRYLSYALATIMHRALPDVRDGLKPVHRRLLYAMHQLKLNPENRFKKSARVVGDVIGRYHPHGDQAVYDALVRLAQDFAVRYPLIDGQGNFGNIDGDNAAAMRYTEARLTIVAHLLLSNIDEDSVDFRETYDGEDKEPVILPGNFPNLLANGASGIAVGMATNIPPHNIVELCKCALHLIKAPNASLKKLMSFVPAPDFPTGGVILEDAELLQQIYETGKGGLRLRASYKKEDTTRGGWQIVITEIPYQVQKARLIEKIADLIHAKQLPLLENILDESTEDIRLILQPKSRTVDVEQFMAMLFRLTDLEVRVSVNMNVLDANQTPRVMGLKEIMKAWLEHRQEVLGRVSRFRLNAIEARLEILEGYLIAYLNLDEVIHIIREEDDPKSSLIKKFKLTERQAEAILNMRLRALRKLEEETISAEHKKHKAEQKRLKTLLASDEMQWEEISSQIKLLLEQFGKKTNLGKRRSKIEDAPKEMEIDANTLIEQEPVTIICSEKGWIRAMKGHLENKEIKYKTGDKEGLVLHAYTRDILVLFASNGRAYRLDVNKLPGGRGNGEPIRLMIDLEESEDILQIFSHNSKRSLLVASNKGYGFIVPESELISTRRAGKQILNLASGEEAAICVPAIGDSLAVLGENKKLLIFPIKEIPQMARGKGIKLQSYKQEGIADVRSFIEKEGLKIYDSAGREQVFNKLDDWQGKRAQAGRKRPKGFPSNGTLGMLIWQEAPKKEG
ncbi:MAG: DNA topoisomerase IV subunit A [Parvibaculales bacterium]